MGQHQTCFWRCPFDQPFSSSKKNLSSAAKSITSYTTYIAYISYKIQIEVKKTLGAKVNTTTENIIRIGMGMSIVLILLWLTSCCAPRFQKAEVPDDMGLVYFYRPKKLFAGSLDYTVNANGFKIDTLVNGRYFTYIAKPGRIQFSARNEITSYLTLDVEPGQIYYIKGSTRPGSLIKRPDLQLISPEEGENEIVLCRPIDKDKEHDANLPPIPDRGKKELAIK